MSPPVQCTPLQSATRVSMKKSKTSVVVIADNSQVKTPKAKERASVESEREKRKSSKRSSQSTPRHTPRTSSTAPRRRRIVPTLIAPLPKETPKGRRRITPTLIAPLSKTQPIESPAAVTCAKNESPGESGSAGRNGNEKDMRENSQLKRSLRKKRRITPTLVAPLASENTTIVTPKPSKRQRMA